MTTRAYSGSIMLYPGEWVEEVRQIKRQELGYTLFIMGVLVFLIASLAIIFLQRRKLELLESEVSQLNVKVIELQSKYDDSLSDISISIVTIEQDVEKLKEKR